MTTLSHVYEHSKLVPVGSKRKMTDKSSGYQGVTLSHTAIRKKGCHNAIVWRITARSRGEGNGTKCLGQFKDAKVCALVRAAAWKEESEWKWGIRGILHTRGTHTTAEWLKAMRQGGDAEASAWLLDPKAWWGKRDDPMA